jgi:hypothetical protein
VSDNPGGSKPSVPVAVRVALWSHAAIWLLFAGGMIVIAALSPASLENPVFLQVMAASSAAAIGSVAAAVYRRWGAALVLLGGLGVIAAWIAGDSGRELRLVIAALLVVFAIIVVSARRAFAIAGER